jgi:hypothetical protein
LFYDRTVGIASHTKDISRRIRTNDPAYVYDSDDDFEIQTAVSAVRSSRQQQRHDEVSVIENINTATVAGGANNTSVSAAANTSSTLVLPTESIPSASSATSPKRKRNAFVSSDDEDNNNTNHNENEFTTPKHQSKRARIIDLGRDYFDDV